MAARLALVIGSECGTQQTLGFVGQLATDLHEKLKTVGGWRPALGGDGPTLNPTIAQLKAVVKAAFAEANADRATLLVAFVGHGLTTGSQDFHLLAIDSPPLPDSDTAYHLTQGIREQLNGAPLLDGLIVLVDACEAGQAVAGAANRWTDVLQGASGRMELLVASGDSSAYDGCFTRTLANVFNVGVDTAGEYLLCADLHPYVAQCPGQTPQLLSFVGGWVALADPGLWLVPNLARRADAVSGRSSAGLVDQLTRGVVITDAMREFLADLVAAEHGSRLRLVVGSSGCGKSTLMSLLIRPALVDTLDITADYIAAAAFLDATTTLESLSEDLADQLELRVPGFKELRDSVRAEMTEQHKQTTTSFEREIVMPLQRCRTPGRRVRIIIDGLDQSEQGGRDLILSAIADLTRGTTNDLDHVQVIVGVRSGVGVDTRPELDDAHRTALEPPTQDDLRRVLPAVPTTLPANLGPAGGWLLARLLNETQETAPAMRPWDVPGTVTLDVVVQGRFDAALQRMRNSGAGVLLTSLLVAAGVGPVLPIELAARILRSDNALTLARDMIVELGALVSRGKAGSPEETVGVAHSEFVGALETAVVRHTKRSLTQAGAETLPVFAAADRVVTGAHAAILSALNELESAGGATPNITMYAKNAKPRHYLAVGDADGAIRAVVAMNTFRAADNRDRWASWVPTFQEQLGIDHPATLTARRNLALWRGESGDVAGAVAELQLLVTDRIRVLGAEHLDTLTTRNDLAGWRAEGGDVAGAVDGLEVLVPEHQRVLGTDHLNTLATRENLARRLGAAGNIAGAAAQYAALLIDRTRVQGPDHPDTLGTRNDFAGLLADAGDVAGALNEFEMLFDEQQRVLGKDHPNTLGTRGNLAVCRAQAGDVASAVAELDAVFRRQQSVLGGGHPNTLTTRRNLALWRKQAPEADLTDAIAELKEVLREYRRVMGVNHPETLAVRAYLAVWRGESGDVARAVAEFEVLLSDQVRVLGPNHPHTFATRGNLARWRGEAGDVAGAVRESEVLLVDLTQLLGANHPHTLTARQNLAHWLTQSGDGVDE